MDQRKFSTVQKLKAALGMPIKESFEEKDDRERIIRENKLRRLTGGKKGSKKSYKKSAKRSVKRSAKKSAKRSVKRSAKRSAKKSPKKSAKRSAKKSTKKTVNKSGGGVSSIIKALNNPYVKGMASSVSNEFRNTTEDVARYTLDKSADKASYLADKLTGDAKLLVKKRNSIF
jgi:hypothetical protein